MSYEHNAFGLLFQQYLEIESWKKYDCVINEIYFQNKLHCATILLLLNLLNQKFVIFNPWTIHAELSPPTDT